VDLVTLSGVFVSGLSMVLALQGKLAWSLCILYLAMLSDSLDGMLARRWEMSTEFGRYLDGFVDTLDYLIAPAIILYVWGFNSVWALFVIGCVITCGFLRLSKFNQIGNVQDETGQLAYLGMPVYWLNFLLALAYIFSWIFPKEIIFTFLFVLYPIACVLMLLNTPFFKISQLKTILIIVFGGMAVFSIGALCGS
jgi:CDP-diacylglycerol--serine O-phosphatidyltransferase